MFDKGGRIIKGIHPRNAWVPVQPNDKGKVRFYVEAAANPEVLRSRSFAPTSVGRKQTADPTPLYRLARADLVEVHHEVRELIADVVTLLGLAEVLPETAARAWTVLRALDEAMDALDLADIVGTAAAARAVLAPALAVRAAEGTHEISAIGHAHIDSAWLWPVRETRRKVARTVADVLHLAESRPGVVFALPAAQHGAWLEEDQPDLFARLQAAVAAGAVVPVGGMWVEPDGNLLAGESVCRQLTFGARWFAERLGHRCDEVWLPDSFGYSAALPQLARLAGMRWMLTQKISWNEVDRFPHHSFLWEGIDGTRIFTHFPPADTYSSELTSVDLTRAASAFADKGRARRSLLPFGYGDGGGGPTREMFAQADRVADLDGSPRVRVESPAAFFERAEAEHRDPSVWVGELYLERHRGTFTSQARTKAGNRRCEGLLREAELWWTSVALRGLSDYPAQALDRLWRQVLLGQFHDILPGSSIGWVHDEVERTHAEVEAELEDLITRALALLCNEGEAPQDADADGPTEWVSFSADPLAGDGVALGGTAYLGDSEPSAPAVTVVATGTAAVLDNGRLQVTIDARGLVTSVRDLAADRELIPPGTVGNLLQCHPDLPNAWDAWDLDPFYRNTVVDLTEVDELGVQTLNDGSAEVRVVRPLGTRGSQATQTLSLAPGAEHLDIEVEVDWRERDTILKLAWPLDVHTPRRASDPVRVRHAPHPREHHVGPLSLRGSRAAVGARRRARLRHRHRQRPHLRLGRQPQRPHRWRDVRDGAGEPAARLAVPRPGRRPRHPPLRFPPRPRRRRRWCRRRGVCRRPPAARRRGPGRAAYRARRARRGGGGRDGQTRRGRQWRAGRAALRAPRPPCRSDLGPRAGRAPGPRPSARGRPARATPGHDRPAIGRSRPRRVRQPALGAGAFPDPHRENFDEILNIL